MQPIQLLRQIPTHVGHAFTQGIATVSMTKRWVADCWKARRMKLCDAWRDYGKPFYKRHIQPLEKADYFLIGGSFLLAGVIIAVTAKFFPALIPVSFMAGALLILKACLSHYNRVHQQRKNAAWHSLDQIRRAVHSSTKTHQNLALISRYHTDVSPADFEDLKEDLSRLGEEIHDFREVICSPSYEEEKNIVLDGLTLFECMVQGHPADEAIIKAIKTQVDQAKKDQDLDRLQSQKGALNGLQSIPVSYILLAKKKMDHLVIAARRATLADSKEALIMSLERVQNKLIPHKKIEKIEEIVSPNVAEVDRHDVEEIEEVVSPNVAEADRHDVEEIEEIEEIVSPNVAEASRHDVEDEIEEEQIEEVGTPIAQV